MSAYCHIYGQLSQTGDRLAEEIENLIRLDLAFDLEMPLPQIARHRDLLLEVQRRGYLVAPTIYPPDLDPSIRDANWWKLDTAECVRLLRFAEAEYARLGFGPLEAINTYTPGNGLVAACRIVGVRYIMGFCAPTVIEDGGWEIAHYGSPLSPYFISEEDYRKPENPGSREDAVLMASMELRNPMVCLNHWSEGPWCPLNALAVDRWLEPSEMPYPFLQIANDWIQQAALDEQPRFFHINLQYFFAGRCFDHNHRALEWLARQRNEGRLKIVGLREWAERMRENGGFLPQMTWWRAEMPGYHAGHRPGLMPDVIVDENLSRQAIWKSPEITPSRLYDYGHAWNYPPFQPDGTAPVSTPSGELRVRWELHEETPTSRRGELILEDAPSSKIPPLVVWEMLAGACGGIRIETPPGVTCRTLPHPTGVGAVALVEIGEVTTHRLPFTVHFTSSSQERPSRLYGNLLAGSTFHLDGRTYTMLAAQTPEKFQIKVRTREGREFTYESLRGNDYQTGLLTEEGSTLSFDGSRLACWYRFWDASLDDLIVEDVASIEDGLAKRTAALVTSLGLPIPNDPPFQTFGNIRDDRRWDRAVGQAAGQRELEKVNAWFHKQRAAAGEVCAELHAGILIPRGSITKVLGHEFDVHRFVEGYHVRELCVDYPQGWDWGVAAWVQWRWMKLRLEGLAGSAQEHTLHLQACDAEHRDLCQRVHFIHPTDNSIPHLCVEPCWEVPAGIESRWEPSALCSIKIPPMCREWPAIDVWISPVERISMYDWIAEKGAPGLLSHLWITRQPVNTASPA